MKYWSSRKIAKGSGVPGKVLRIGDALSEEFSGHGEGAPTLMRIGRWDSDYDFHRWEVDVELAPGVVLPMGFGLLESLHDGLEDPADDEARVIEDTLEGVDACMPMIARLADILHESRVAARVIVAGWADQGLVSRVANVRLAPYDHWRGERTPQIRVSVEGLDNCLQTAVDTQDTWQERNLARTLAEIRDGLAQRHAERDRLARRGATGTISQVALNAIAEFGDVAETLRRFRTEWRFELPDDTMIKSSGGQVDVAGSYLSPAPPVDWLPNGLSVAAYLVRDRDLAAAVGRPVTQLIDHPFLSADMSVQGTTWSEDEAGRRWLEVDLAMPWKLFCSTSGRVWDAVEPAPTGGNVVPFARRA